MKLQWEQTRRGRYVGRSEEGIELVQVAHVLGPMGADHWWMMWLRFEAAELFDRYPSAEAAMVAAESAVDPPSD